MEDMEQCSCKGKKYQVIGCRKLLMFIDLKSYNSTGGINFSEYGCFISRSEYLVNDAKGRILVGIAASRN
ncbi:hypothetical protein P029_02505 [Anaplasma phagocytophilum str. Norway variant2]|nr:hypothetical protein P029_02505 [Anaplasma phagocytophilum str. Norway variant2]